MLTIKDYTDGLKEDKILGSKCNRCGQLMIPLKSICPKCGSFDVEEFETTGNGVIRIFTIIYVAPEKFKDEVPYIVALINLDEGGTVMGRLIGVDPNKPEDIKVVTKVKFECLIEGGDLIPTFKSNN